MDKVIQVVSGWLFSPDQTKVLIVNNVGGVWSPPGGAVEAGEYLESALVREMFEETGLHICPERLIGVSEGFSARKPEKIVFFSFLVNQLDPGQMPSIIRPDEISEVKWVGPDELCAKLPWIQFDVWDVVRTPDVRLYKSVVL